MTNTSHRQSLSRRALLTGGAGLAGAVVIGSKVPGARARRLVPVPDRRRPHPAKEVHLVGTDGWVVHAGRAPRGSAVLPRPAGAERLRHLRLRLPRRHRDDRTQVAAQRGEAQISAPMLDFDEEDDIKITLTNLGLVQRPDLFDGHTLHWHGFVNAIPAVRRRAGAVGGGADRPRLHLLLPAARRRHVHVPLPLRGRRARADGHDRHRLRPAEAERPADYGQPAGTVRLQRRRRLDPLRPRVRLHAHRALVGGPLPRRPHPGQRLDRLRPELLAAERPRLPRHARAQRRPAVAPRPAGCSTSRSRRWCTATPASGCCCGCRTSATSSTP